MDINKLPNWLRWILVPIASILTWVIVSILATVAAKLFIFFGGDKGWSESFFTHLLIPGFASYSAVYATYMMAPAGNARVAFTFSLLWALVSGYFSFFSALVGNWTALIAPIAMAIGCTYAAIEFRIENKSLISIPEDC